MNSIRSVSDAIKIIDDAITREVKWADEPILILSDDIQRAWYVVKNNTR